jgi:glucosamine-6-phosphate deaminase
MLLKVFNNRAAMGQAAAEQAAVAIRRAIAEHGNARIIAATAASQLEFLDALTKSPGIDWERVEVFHLDEYIGRLPTREASVRCCWSSWCRKPEFPATTCSTATLLIRWK